MTRKKNRFAPPSKITINGRDVFVSAHRSPQDLPLEVLDELMDIDGGIDRSKICDRLWSDWVERGGFSGRWIRTNTAVRNLPNGVTVYEGGELQWGVEPNPFRNTTEPHLRAALRAKGFLPFEK